MASEGRDQGVRDAVLPAEAGGARPDPQPEAHGIAALIQRVMALKPVRVFLHYSNDNGPLIASGMTYQAFFALAGALWFGFAVLGFAIKDDTGLQNQVFAALNAFLPNLIAYDGRQGLLKGSDLVGIAGLSWSSAISLLIVLYTAIGFLATLRTAVRIMFGLPNEQGNFALLKLRDLGLALAFGALVLLTAAITILSNAALGFTLGLLGLGGATGIQTVVAPAIALVVLAGIETVMLAAAFRILSGIPVPRRRLWAGAAIGGVALAVLQTLASSLLHLGSNNPVIGGFAVLVGLLVFFSFVCQIILVSAAWVAVGMLDAGIDARSLSPEEKAEDRAKRIEEARRIVARANREVLEQRVREARGLRRWRLTRELQREVREEARRRERVPTASEFTDARTGSVPAQSGRRSDDER